MSVKNFLDEVIEEKGITFVELAKDLDVSYQTIYNVRTTNGELLEEPTDRSDYIALGNYEYKISYFISYFV